MILAFQGIFQSITGYLCIKVSEVAFLDAILLQVIESLAFEEEPPEFTEQDDLTMPDNEGILQEAKEELIAFRVSLCGSSRCHKCTGTPTDSNTAPL